MKDGLSEGQVRIQPGVEETTVVTAGLDSQARGSNPHSSLDTF